MKSIFRLPVLARTRRFGMRFIKSLGKRSIPENERYSYIVQWIYTDPTYSLGVLMRYRETCRRSEHQITASLSRSDSRYIMSNVLVSDKHIDRQRCKTEPHSSKPHSSRVEGDSDRTLVTPYLPPSTHSPRDQLPSMGRFISGC